jgi:hypothetical protein
MANTKMIISHSKDGFLLGGVDFHIVGLARQKSFFFSSSQKIISKGKTMTKFSGAPKDPSIYYSKSFVFFLVEHSGQPGLFL